MLQYLKQESNKTFTENGAATLQSTLSDCLDLFATVGALRRQSDDEIIARFMRAYTEDKDIAMKLLFFARDIRGGLGERKVFRVILKWLAQNEPNTVRKNLAYIAEYGRYDDLLVLFGTPVEKEMLSLIREQLHRDISAMNNGEEVSLLGKWLPSVNASNAETVKTAKKIARYLGMDDKTYRQTLTRLRGQIRIIENNLREKDYTFDYEKQPSKAMFKYRNAFARNDAERYNTFLNSVSSGEAKLNASTLAPYELVEPYLTPYWYNGHHSFMKQITAEEKKSLNATWEALPAFGSEANALAVIDTSGSMYCDAKPLPAAVALSLGIYFAEHNTGVFKNHFIEFSSKPELIEIKGDTFAEKLQYICSFNEIADTNIEAVFDLVLNAAVNNNLPQSELPDKLIIISDMEFNACVKNAGTTNFNNAKKKFVAAGYKLPEVVFWNVASRNRQQPVSKNEQGVALVSGCTPRLFSMIAEGNVSAATPYQIMLEVLCGERYEKIAA
ncbi:MAG: DUF2828 family protein [Clostridia bacterium]|nr:DUF2828 family protein [Clostridia bacterium]